MAGAPRHGRSRGVREAVLAAVLFGGATPFAARLAGDVPAPILAGLLYLGSGVVLTAVVALSVLRARGGGGGRGGGGAGLERRDLPWLLGATFFGGGLGPLLLIVGLRATPASTASLLLNLEVVFTAVIAWLVFHESLDRRLWAGLGLVLAGGVLLSWSGGGDGGGVVGPGALAVVGACACWAIDNNLTQKVSAKDPRRVAAVKGVVAGSANLVLGLATGGALPSVERTAAAMAIGVVGYGASLVLFVGALRSLGSARTGAYFSLAPFVGVGVAVLALGGPAPARLVPAGLLMAAGVALHLTERHGHRHTHGVLAHVHAGGHDDLHGPASLAAGPAHVHAPAEHEHGHTPDIHHRDHGHR